MIQLFFLFTTLALQAQTYYESFISSYDLSGRYTHEYHPFVLRKTGESFAQLERALQASFTVDGRLLIFGYQEEAVPPYRTEWQRVHIRDEVEVQSERGMTPPARNIFGFMTGFALHDTQWLARAWNSEPPIICCSAHPVSLFDSHAVLFQKHAFGKEYPLLLATRDSIERALYKQETKGILRALDRLWTSLYERAATTGSQEAVSAQDSLFSIAYVRALLAGTVPVKRMFVGPDITYPIEVSQAQKAGATEHAQAFVPLIEKELIAQNDRTTAYVFCSFVDGVGKSTLLNNIKNYQRWGTDLNSYHRCDNSSSQHASIYKLKEKVFLVDLPAQISHYTNKPDGSVFVALETVRELMPLQPELRQFVVEHKQLLLEQFLNLHTTALSQEKALYADADPLHQYARNVVTLGIDPVWIPFSYRERFYLFKKDDPFKLRVLVPFEQVHSSGLKVIEPEAMLFNKGLSRTVAYDTFLQDLVDQLKAHQVEHLVFVDFLSMYPRTSRETIRLNFVIQYLKKLFGAQYSLNDSFYQHTVYHEQELCALLVHRLPHVEQMITLETALRCALYSLVTDPPPGPLSGAALEQQLRERTTALRERYTTELARAVHNRLVPERAVYSEKYSLDRIYETIVRFSPEPICAFSELFESRSRYKNLWKEMEQTTPRCTLPSACRDEESLKTWVRTVRAHWYLLLSSLVVSTYRCSPLIVEDKEGILTASVKKLEQIEHELPTSWAMTFNLKTGRQFSKWGKVDDEPYLLSAVPSGTFFGIYAFGYDPFKTAKNTITKLIDEYRLEATRQGTLHKGMAISDLYQRILDKGLLASIEKEVNQDAEPLKPSQKSLIQLWVRMTATLEMILKDTAGHILVRKGHKGDFTAAVRLLEKVTLPLYYKIFCKEPLFPDYDAVEPVLPWELMS